MKHNSAIVSKYFLLVLFSLISTCPISAQQDRPGIPMQPNTIVVGADGEFESEPDTAIINFMLSAQDNDSQAAFARASRAADRVREVLRSNRVDPKSAELSSYNLQPIYDYKSPKRRIVGYTVATNVEIKLKDFKKIAPLLQDFSTIEETANQSLGYTLEQVEDAKSKAIDKAFQRAQLYAQSLAKASGRSLGELSFANIDILESGRIVPLARFGGMAAATAKEPAPAAPTEGFGEQKITVTAHLTAGFRLQ